MTDEKVANVLILAALERISMEEPDWTYVAADVYLNELYRKAADNRGYDKKEVRFVLSAYSRTNKNRHL